MTQLPWFVRLFGPLNRRLLALGVPLGPNTLMTIRGRRSGLPRTVGVALIEVDERQWVIGTFGEVHWVRNLRAAGEAVIRIGGRPQRVAVSELSTDEAATYFREVLVPYVQRLPLGLRMAASIFVREIVDDPAGAATRSPVFELHPLPDR